MADQKLTEVYVTNPVSLDPGDLGYTVENTGTTPAYGAFKFSQLMSNRYKITPTVSSNDLVLALKHEDGNNPSTDRPLYFKIGNSLRACTAALSVTKADGTNWANLGSAELGTKEQDLFVYAVWNTNLTPDAVDIFWSRIPYGRLYSDFSATTTNEKYAAINSTAPASTDECVLIGRFAATLSLSGTSHLWTVPTYTNSNLIHAPVSESRWMNWQPAYSGSGSLTYTSVTTTFATYKIRDDATIEYRLQSSGTLGGSASTTLLSTLPFESSQSANSDVCGYGLTATVTAKIFITAGTPDQISFQKYDSSNYATSGACVNKVNGMYQI